MTKITNINDTTRAVQVFGFSSVRVELQEKEGSKWNRKALRRYPKDIRIDTVQDIQRVAKTTGYKL